MVMLIDELSPTARLMLRELPDMLSGKEPFLTSAAARRALREDPGCREVLLAVANLTASFTSNERRSASGVSRPVDIQRVLERVHFGQRHALAMAYWAAALDDCYALVSRTGLAFVTNPREVVAPEHTSQVALIGGSCSSPRDSMEQLLRAFEKSRPGDPAARYLRECVADAVDGAVQPQTWIEIARASSAREVRAASIQKCAIAMSDHGLHDSAIELAEAALLLEPRIEVAYDFALISARAVNPRAMIRAVRSLDRHWSGSDSSQRSLVRSAFLKDAAMWSRDQKALGTAMSELWSVLGSNG